MENTNRTPSFGMRVGQFGLEFVTMPNYTTAFEFEGQFEYVKAHQWMAHNWHTSFYWIGAYLLFIFLGQHWMKSRPRYELQGPLALWNCFLAAFSIMGTYRTIPETIYMLNQKNGFHNSVCFPTHEHNSVWALWAYAFVLSKALELGDTVFIVLRKQPLIFLHWYHHCTVLLYSWYSYSEYIAPSRWYIVLNFTIHSFMYSYYGLKALRYRIPKPFAVFITSIQLVQMVVGVIVNLHAYQAKSNGIECDVNYHNINLSLIMYTSYFILFLRFFYKTYLSSSTPRPISKSSLSSSKVVAAAATKKELLKVGLVGKENGIGDGRKGKTD